MRGIRPSLTLGACTITGLALWASTFVDQGGSTMATAADRFVRSLDDAARAKAVFKFDDPERINWHFIPRPRRGLPIKEMTPEQRALAFGLIESGLSQSGSLKATTIMSLEAVLRDLEKGSGPLRDPEMYFVSIFGEPGNSGRWGWRVEGHHLSLNFSLENGEIASATPAFFGANPAEVRNGPREGLRTLADLEDRALRLVQSLDEDQKKVALVVQEAPRDIESNYGASGNAGLPVKPASDAREGLPASKLTPDQRKMLVSLIQAYAGDMPDEVASAWLGEVKAAGDDLAFAWYGEADRTKPHGYQVQGPTFQIEFNNTQNGANHIHSLWRNTLDDFDLAGR